MKKILMTMVLMPLMALALELNPAFTPEAVAQYKEKADVGDVEAQYLYSFALANGMGIAKNEPKAMVYAQKAAAQGFGLAFYRVAVGYEQGWGVSSNGVGAAKWYGKFVQWAKPKAEQGDVHAQCDLGVCYEYGDGVEKNKEEAARWYRKAAEQGYARAQCNLGVCYCLGQGVKQDFAEAARWYRKAAEQGHARAQYNLGGCYCLGQGVKQDFAEAARWHRKASKQGRRKGWRYFGLDLVKGIEWAYTVKDGFATIDRRPGSFFPTPSISAETVGAIEIPSRLGGCSVSRVGNNAFWTCKGLTRVVIPECVTEIEAGAFSGCSGLKEVVIPNGVTNIGNRAFSLCEELTNVTIPQNVISIGEGAFSSCKNLTSVTVPQGVRDLKASTFQGCENLTNAKILKGVTSIGDEAFWDCKCLTSISIPESVTSIEEDAFGCCAKLVNICLPGSMTNLGEKSFCGCENLVNVDVPRGVTSIGAETFSWCWSLTKVTIPQGVTNIGNEAFSACRSLKYVNIPEGVTHIGARAFEGCRQLENVIIPKSVVSIGANAFGGCDKLTDVEGTNDRFSGTGIVSGSDLVKENASKPRGYTQAQLIQIYKKLKGRKLTFEEGELASVEKGDYGKEEVVISVCFKDAAQVDPQSPAFIVLVKVSNPLIVKDLKKCSPGIKIKSLSGTVGRVSELFVDMPEESSLFYLELTDGNVMFNGKIPDVKSDFDVEKLSSEEILLRLNSNMTAVKKGEFVKALSGRKVTFKDGVFQGARQSKLAFSEESVVRITVDFHREEMSDQICSWKSVIGTISDKGMQDYALGLDHETKIESMTGIVDEEWAEHGVFSLRNVLIREKK